jgi:sulfur-carrier protein
MVTVRFTKALKRFFPDLIESTSYAGTILDILLELNNQYPGFKNYILDEQGALRKHVNIFIDGDMIQDRKFLTDTIGENSEIYIIQALSGG